MMKIRRELPRYPKGTQDAFGPDRDAPLIPGLPQKQRHISLVEVPVASVDGQVKLVKPW